MTRAFLQCTPSSRQYFSLTIALNSMIFILFIIAFFSLLFYLKHKYFTLYGTMPGLSPQFLFGNLLQSDFFNGQRPPQILLSFKQRFGDVFQFWFGPSRFIIVSNITDVEHIFTHRSIYEQGNIFIEKFSVSYSKSLISTTGLFRVSLSNHSFLLISISRHQIQTTRFTFITFISTK